MTWHNGARSRSGWKPAARAVCAKCGAAGSWEWFGPVERWKMTDGDGVEHVCEPVESHDVSDLV